MLNKLHKIDKLAVKGKAGEILVAVFRYALLILISFIILFPFISKISASFMSVNDMNDTSVIFVPREATLDNYKTVIKGINYVSTALRTLGLSLLCAIPQTLVCAVTGYALAKLKGKLGKIGMALVIITILVPPQIIMVPMYLKFRFFDVLGVINLLSGTSLNLLNKLDGVLPFIVLSCTGMAFKNGIYIFLLRQFYKGVPEELEEAAYMDGCNTIRAYFKIIMPISVPMMVTIFMLSFAWQWTDTFYTNLFLKSDRVLATAIFTMSDFTYGTAGTFYKTALIQTAVILSLLPLIVMYLIGQKKLIGGIERSGITG